MKSRVSALPLRVAERLSAMSALAASDWRVLRAGTTAVSAVLALATIWVLIARHSGWAFAILGASVPVVGLYAAIALWGNHCVASRPPEQRNLYFYASVLLVENLWLWLLCFAAVAILISGLGWALFLVYLPAVAVLALVFYADWISVQEVQAQSASRGARPDSASESRN